MEIMRDLLKSCAPGWIPKTRAASRIDFNPGDVSRYIRAMARAGLLDVREVTIHGKPATLVKTSPLGLEVCKRSDPAFADYDMARQYLAEEKQQ